MKKIILILNIAILIISCNAVSEPSEKQLSFSNQLLETPGVINTEWYNNLSLNVTVDLESLGPLPQMKAQVLADEIAAKGFEETETSICVTIYYGYKNKLASSCFYD